MEKMFKVTRGDFVGYTDKYPEAEKLFRRIARRKYPCGSYTRLYWNSGNGYSLSMVTGKRLENAFVS